MTLLIISEVGWILLVLLVAMTLGTWYRSRKLKMTILERNGIPGPRPNFFYGNLAQYNSMPNVLWDSWLINTYGSITGYYLGAKPVIVLANPELIRKIQRTDVNVFLDRPRRVPGGINPDPHRALMLGNLSVDKWNNLRKILSPSFNQLNLRAMMSPINDLMVKMIKSIDANDAETDFYVKFQRLTLDIIGKTAFGIDSNIQETPDDPLMAAVEAEFTKSTNSLVVQIYLCLPELSMIIHPIRVWIEKVKVDKGWSNSSALWTLGRRAVADRRKEQQIRPDLLQKLLDSNMGEDEIVANSVLFFEAAYETLSSSLAFIVHLLVHHQEVQSRLRHELQGYLEEHGRFDFLIFTELAYMDRVIKEALRLFPPQTTFIGRSPNKDYTFVNAADVQICSIPKGTHIQVALFQMHHSVEGWINPEEFDPDRFLDVGNKTGDWWQPFGIGKRQCIGKGFANLVLKLMLAKLCSKYILEPSNKTEELGRVSIHFKTATMTPRNGSWARATPVAA